MTELGNILEGPFYSPDKTKAVMLIEHLDGSKHIYAMQISKYDGLWELVTNIPLTGEDVGL